MIWETVKLALRSVRRNALRSFLTLLGIVIGVAAVIAMITIGQGTTEKVKADISSLGSNLLVVPCGARPAWRRHELHPRALEQRDVEALSSGLTTAKAVAPASSRSVRVVYARRTNWRK